MLVNFLLICEYYQSLKYRLCLQKDEHRTFLYGLILDFARLLMIHPVAKHF